MIFFEKKEQNTNQYTFCLHYTLIAWGIYEILNYLFAKLILVEYMLLKLKQNLETLKVIMKNEIVKKKKEKI